MIYLGKAPYRISLLGGGSDLDWFVDKESFGISLGYALDKYSYSVVNRLPSISNYGILNYSIRETYCDPKEITHPLIRESIKYFENLGLIELSSYGYASGGSGLGGSSSFLLSLLAALHLSQSFEYSSNSLANIASEIEINILSKPIGRQDQYISSEGGINAFKFKRSGDVNKISISREKRAVLSRIIDSLYLIPSNKTRPADKVLNSLKDNPSSIRCFKMIREIANSFINCEEKRDSYLEEKFHESVRQSWEIKSKMTNVMDEKLKEQFSLLNKIPNNWIRLLGAGSGGYFLICPKESPEIFRQSLFDKGFDVFAKASLSNQGVSSMNF